MAHHTSKIKLLAVALHMVRLVVTCPYAILLPSWNRPLACSALEAVRVPRLPTDHNCAMRKAVATARAVAGVLPLDLPWLLVPAPIGI